MFISAAEVETLRGTLYPPGEWSASLESVDPAARPDAGYWTGVGRSVDGTPTDKSYTV